MRDDLKADNPKGQITRGKTARNRLRQIDHFIELYDPSLIVREGSDWVVDLGYGAEPVTSLEMMQRWRQLNKGLKLLGVEIDPERVRLAQQHANKLNHFRCGGFDLPLQTGESVRLLRALNVLRQYREEVAKDVYEQIMAQLAPGALLIEGTSMPSGHHWSVNLCRKVGKNWQPEALVFYQHFRADMDLDEFKAILPKHFIHRMQQDQPIYQFFAHWQMAQDRARSQSIFSRRQWWHASICGLADFGWQVNTQKRFTRRGYLVVTDPRLLGQIKAR